MLHSKSHAPSTGVTAKVVWSMPPGRWTSSRAFFLVFLLGDGVAGFCHLFDGAIPKLKQKLNENDVLSIEEQVLRRSVEERVLSNEKQVSRRKCWGASVEVLG
jgi:hypothetical protein